MSVLPGDDSFVTISQSIFRVETRWHGGSSVGTGFVVGKFRESNRLVVGTAKHVIEFPDHLPIWWNIRQFDEHGAIARQLTFETKPSASGEVPYRTHKDFDVALFRLPLRDSEGKQFTYDGEDPPYVIDPGVGASTGTRVAWAGFPGMIEGELGHPQLCYFEGSVAAMINRDDNNLYVVDGHASPGVSGGPVWQWDADNRRPEIVGIVCSYATLGGSWPGMCFFEPTGPVMLYLEHWRQQVRDDFLITHCRARSSPLL